MEGKRRSAWQRVLFSAWMRPVLLVVILLVVWDLVIRLFRIPPYLIPAPEAVVKQLVAEWPKLWRESLVTTYATLGGFALSIAFGIPMALLIAYSRTVESFVYPLLVFSQSVPKIAIAPLFVVWFGFGIIPQDHLCFPAGLFPGGRFHGGGIQVGRPRHDRPRALDEGVEARRRSCGSACLRRCRRSSRG